MGRNRTKYFSRVFHRRKSHKALQSFVTAHGQTSGIGGLSLQPNKSCKKRILQPSNRTVREAKPKKTKKHAIAAVGTTTNGMPPSQDIKPTATICPADSQSWPAAGTAARLSQPHKKGQLMPTHQAYEKASLSSWYESTRAARLVTASLNASWPPNHEVMISWISSCQKFGWAIGKKVWQPAENRSTLETPPCRRPCGCHPELCGRSCSSCTWPGRCRFLMPAACA